VSFCSARRAACGSKSLQPTRLPLQPNKIVTKFLERFPFLQSAHERYYDSASLLFKHTNRRRNYQTMVKTIFGAFVLSLVLLFGPPGTAWSKSLKNPDNQSVSGTLQKMIVEMERSP
jgi:hypothetical protein